MNTCQERRRSERLEKPQAPVPVCRLRQKNRWETVELIDISGLGLAVVTHFTLPMTQHVRLQLQFQDTSRAIELIATPVWEKVHDLSRAYGLALMETENTALFIQHFCTLLLEAHHA